MRKESECSCNSCKMMCMNSPCFPTPQDVLRLEKENMLSYFTYTVFVDVTTMKWYDIIAPIGAKLSHLSVQNKCVFLDNNQLCMLHNYGLKPTEGKLMKHDVYDSLAVRLEILETWNNDEGEELLDRLYRGERRKTLEEMKNNYDGMIKYGRE